MRTMILSYLCKPTFILQNRRVERKTSGEMKRTITHFRVSHKSRPLWSVENVEEFSLFNAYWFYSSLYHSSLSNIVEIRDVGRRRISLHSTLLWSESALSPPIFIAYYILKLVCVDRIGANICNSILALQYHEFGKVEKDRVPDV
jgi:hypothetical protein